MVSWYLPWTSLDAPEVIQIDQRGHGLMLRCCIVIVLVGITFRVWKLSQGLQGNARKRVQKLFGAPWMNVAECVADLPLP
ncbi:hypothetical protein MUP79_05390 [Candidatus Bathyarchaeota archaeon]|nr:hypothetical protein [Candidatus Bathyarchaeota archaeon]